MNYLLQRYFWNELEFWRAHSVLFCILVVALFCDGVSTCWFMTQDCIEIELHPGVYAAAVMFGPIAGPLIAACGKVVAAIVVGLYFRKIAWAIYILATAVSFWAAWYNVWGCRIYTPAILEWWPL